MIVLGKDKVDERYNIDDNGTITALDGTVQELKLHQDRLTFKGQYVHKIQYWTNFGWYDGKKFAIHHKDLNHLNNNINNLEILTKSEHNRLHMNLHNANPLLDLNKSDEERQNYLEKISKALKGRKFSEEHKKKMSQAHKGINTWTKGKHWKKDPITGKRIYY